MADKSCGMGQLCWWMGLTVTTCMYMSMWGYVVYTLDIHVYTMYMCWRWVRTYSALYCTFGIQHLMMYMYMYIYTCTQRFPRRSPNSPLATVNVIWLQSALRSNQIWRARGAMLRMRTAQTTCPRSGTR